MPAHRRTDMRRTIALVLVSCGLLVACGSDEPDAPADSAKTPTAKASPVPLAATGVKLEWRIPGVPAPPPPGARVPVGVEVKNVSNQAWIDAANAPSPGNTVRLGYRWWKAGATPQPLSDFRQERGELSRLVTPGATGVAVVVVKAPDQPGDYLLQLDLVQELVAWFERRGAAKLL